MDHPRGCGENSITAAVLWVHGGSPPRMRGKPLEEVAKYGAAGITPADAGKTNPNPRGRSVGEDHPRGCGENRVVYRLVVHSSGSPPRMRGKLTVKIGVCNEQRITPADAGKTFQPC